MIRNYLVHWLVLATTTCFQRVSSLPSLYCASSCHSLSASSSVCASAGLHVDFHVPCPPCAHHKLMPEHGGQRLQKTFRSSLLTVWFVKTRTMSNLLKHSAHFIRMTILDCRPTSRRNRMYVDRPMCLLTTWNQTIRSWRMGQWPRQDYIPGVEFISRICWHYGLCDCIFHCLRLWI